MKLKKLLIVLFCAAVLTTGLFAGETVDNCAKFDGDLKNALSHYGHFGVDVKLLRVTGHPVSLGTASFFCCEIMLWVEPVVRYPKPVADTWHFCGGGSPYKTTGPVPAGARVIDQNKLIGCCKAAAKLPKSFPVNKATISLFWALYLPSSDSGAEPYYHFVFGDEHYAVGAYDGKLN